MTKESNMNTIIMDTFKKVAKEHNLSGITISRIESYMEAIAGAGENYAHDMEDDIKEILDGIAEEDNGY